MTRIADSALASVLGLLVGLILGLVLSESTYLVNVPLGGDIDIFSTVDDCAACGGAQYGAEDALEEAFDALHDALGVPRPPYRAAR